MKSERRPNSGVRGAFRRRVTRSLHLIRTIPSTPNSTLAANPLWPPPAAHFPSAAMLLWVRHLPRSLPSRLHAKGVRAAPPPFRERLLRDLYILSPGNRCMTSSGAFQGLSVRAGWVFRTDKALSIGEVDLSPAIAAEIGGRSSDWLFDRPRRRRRPCRLPGSASNPSSAWPRPNGTCR